MVEHIGQQLYVSLHSSIVGVVVVVVVAAGLSKQQAEKIGAAHVENKSDHEHQREECGHREDESDEDAARDPRGWFNACTRFGCRRWRWRWCSVLHLFALMRMPSTTTTIPFVLALGVYVFVVVVVVVGSVD